MQDKVRAFRAGMRLHNPEQPELPLSSEIELLKRLLGEEYRELRDELIEVQLRATMADPRPDIARVAGEAVDVIFISLNILSAFGVDVGPVFDAIADANLRKLGGPKCPYTGKLLKPDGWERPNIEEVLFGAAE